MLEVKSFKQMRVVRIGGQLSAGLLFLLLAFSALPLNLSSDGVEAETDPTVPGEITFTGANLNATVSINPSETGTFGTTSGNANIRFTIATTNYSGYTLTAKSSKTTLDRSGSGQLLSLASAVSQSNFSTASNTTLNGRWGYKPNYYNSSSNTNYRPAPSSSGVTLDKTTAANLTAKSYTIALGARVDYSLPSGSYVNDTFQLQYVANPVPYTISFNDNVDDDIVTNMPSSITGSSTSPDTVTLPSLIPQRANYTFAGWCTVQPTEVAGGQSCPGTLYANSGNYGMNYTVNNSSVVLYATWTSNRGCNKAATTIGTGVTATDAVCMQDINDTVIASMAQDVQHTLIDMRDGKSYFVSKLIDGKVWMTQNLDYHLDNSKTLTHHNTDLGYTVENLSQTWTPSRATAADTSGYVRDDNTAYSFNRDNYYVISSGSTNNDTLSTTCTSGATCPHFNSGTMYNWPAAVAENITTETKYESEPDSVCPAGWRLSEGHNVLAYSELNALFYLYGYVNEYVSSGNTSFLSSGFNNARSNPFYLIRAGYLTSTSLSSGGVAAYYQTSTVSSAIQNYYFYSYSTYIAPMYLQNRGYAGSVRCVARMTTGTTTVYFHNNGAPAGVDFHQDVDAGRAVNLHYLDAFTKPGYLYTSWNTQPDGSGTSYSGDDALFVAAGSTTTHHLYAQWVPAYQISYDGNNATSSDMQAYYLVEDGTSITWHAPNYKRTGYGFAGWSLTQIDPDASNAATLMANAKIWGPNETIVANSTNLGTSVPATIKVYAVWVKSSGTMQNWSGCSSLTATAYSNGTITPGSVVALTDSRDNNTYAIAKLPDGNCWMIENLRLNSANSSDSTKAEGFGGIFTGLANSEDVFAGTSSNSLYNSSNITGSNLKYRMPRYNNNNTNFGGTNASGVSLVTSWNNNNDHVQWHGYGNYYSWAAAKANTSDFGFADTGDTHTSICPKGWFFPYGTLNTSLNLGYLKLNNSLGGGQNSIFSSSTNPTGEVLSARWRTYPINYVYNGGYNNSTSSDRGSRGYYWASSSNSTSAYALSIAPTTWELTSNWNKFVGYGMRCVRDVSFRVIYDGNGADLGNYMRTSQTAVAGSTIVLIPSNFKRAGYGFLGWSYTQLDPEASDFTTQLANAVSAGNVFGPNETITLPSTITNDITLYAIWIKPAGNMQDWSGCPSLSSGSVTALTDTRDNTVYAVAKLADGNCWMIENLRLNATASTDNTKSQGFGGVFTGLANSELSSFASVATANSLYTVDPSSTSLNVITGGDNLLYRIPRFNGSSASLNTVITSASGAIYTYGNYYNYAAAMASTAEMTTTASSEWSGTSICPKGWRLPTGGASGSNKEFEVLNTNANAGSTTSSAAIRSYPNNFVLSGYVWNSAISGRGSYGQYISSSAGSGTGFYEYQISTSAVNVGRSVYRSIGDSVRCVANTGVTITLNSNDGSGKVAHIYVPSGTAVTLPMDVFENENHKLIFWNTASNSSGTNYTSITPSSDVTLYAQWATAYTIVYDGNNATGTTNMDIIRHTGVLSGDSIMLYANNFIRDGYGFLGWSATQIDPDASNASTLISNAKIFGPNQSITANSTNLGVNPPTVVTLYAVWLKASGTFQNWNGCASLTAATYNSGPGEITPGSFVALTDTRGTTANTYAIARLPGGNCWMIEDARFDVANDTLTTANTNHPTATFLANRTNTPSTCTSATTQSCSESIIYSNGTDLSRGVYYGWFTATAGNGLHASTSSNDSDICPIGWHVPISYGTGEYGTLLSHIGGAANTNYTNTSSPTAAALSARLRSFPLNFLYAGDTQGANTYAYRTEGYYNSANGWNNGSNYYRYYFGISNEFVRTSYGWSKYMGFRLRCVYAPEIRYDGNGATSGSVTATNRLFNVSSIILHSSNYERTGYGFLGWSPVANGTGTIYGPNETVSVASLAPYADATGNVTMYAIWVQSTGNLQNWSGCDSLTKPTVNGVMTAKENVTALTDTRDNRTYTVARLADGNCYMNENLRLGASEISTDLTSGNTNVSTTVTAATFNGWRTTGVTATATAGFVYTGFSNYEKNTINYNYCAATAGTICVDSTTESATYDICPAGWRLSTGGYMSGDIAGLYNLGYNTSALARKSVVNGGLGLTMNANVGASDISAQYLTSATALASVYAPYLTSSVFSGTYQASRSYHGPVRCVYDKPRVNLTVSYGSGISSVTVNGSSVPSGRALRLDQGSTVTVVMYLKEDYAFSSWNTSGGTLGVSAQTTTFTLGTGTSASITGYASFTGTYIQNMSDTLCTTTARKVYDSRDMQSYYVKRLSDGNCWMVTNLNLGGVSFYNNLTSANSNLSTTVTYSTFNGWKKTSSASTYTDGEFMVLTGNDATTGTPYGTLYNYYAATGGTISGDSNSTNATYDICPAGWRLPTGGNGNFEYYNIYNYYNSYSSMRASYNNGGAAFNQPGWFGGGSATSNVNLGLSGSFWSSTTYNYNYRYGMYVATSGSTVQRDAPMIRNGGHSIRCIKKPDGVTLNVNYSRGVTAVYVNGNYIADGSSANVALGNSVPIIAYVKDGYSFYGWTVGKGSISSSSAYSTTYTAPSSSVTTTLNADARFLGTTIQGFPASYCTSTPRTVYDNRDDQAYTVARLKDGRCWMIDDLRLGYNTIYTDLTSTNTNLSSTITAATFSSWKNQAGSVSSGGFTTPSTGTDPTSGRAYGVTYNYYAASAGTISGDSNSSNATYDICPVGWRLPTGVSTTGDFAKMFAVYNTYSLIKSPVTDGGAAMNDYSPTSGVSRYWSSTYNSSNTMRTTYVTTSYISSTFNLQRQYKNTIRCVLKNDSYNISNLTYLQDWNSLSSANKTSVLNSMYDSVLYHLKDNRDNQTYDVAKLKDGHIWITQNLNLGSANISVNLTSANTNIASTVTSSTFNSWRKSSITPTLTSGELMYINGTDSTSGTPYGVMYNYCAASGGTYCSSSSTADASYDLCPAGWRMPTSGMGSSYDIYNFGLNYQTAAQMFGPVTSGGAAFTLGGRATGGNLISYSGTYGDYWSSNNSGSTTWMKTWNFDSSSVADAQANRGYAINVRCIGK